MISPEILLERIKLKNQVGLWRNLFLVLVGIFFIFIIVDRFSIRGASNYIASINISDSITQDSYNAKILESLVKAKNVKALIIKVNSPGGTSYGGEDLYQHIAKISKNKPVVAVVETMATSAAYMVILPAHRIWARNNSLTGSVGAIMIMPEISELLDKLGIKIKAFKKGSLKASPMPFEKLTATSTEMIDSIIDDNYQTFLDMVLKHRAIKPGSANYQLISDSRVLTGRQALHAGLIDEIGGEEEALEWLRKNHQLEEVVVKEVVINNADSSIRSLLDKYLLSKATSWLHYAFSTIFVV